MILPDGCPRHSMWGQVDYASRIADGWWSVGTPSHGGHILSRQRWLLMPPTWRETQYSRGGQYEEDCDWVLPVVWFRDEFRSHVLAEPDVYPLGFDPLEQAWKTFTRYHPERAADLHTECGIIDLNMRGTGYDAKMSEAYRSLAHAE